jgi:ABC-2 type transport system ATP-binding protein
VLPVSGGAQTLVEAIRRIDRDGTKIVDIGLRRPSLDDVFLALTGHHAEDEPESKELVGAGAGKKGSRR